MDKEKALKIWLPVIADGVKGIPECKESLEMAIKALEDIIIISEALIGICEYECCAYKHEDALDLAEKYVEGKE